MTKIQVIQYDPTSTVKFVSKEATAPRHLSGEEEGALVAAVNATGILRDRTIIALLLLTKLRTQAGLGNMKIGTDMVSSHYSR